MPLNDDATQAPDPLGFCLGLLFGAMFVTLFLLPINVNCSLCGQCFLQEPLVIHVVTGFTDRCHSSCYWRHATIPKEPRT